ncbi:MAG TPA: hypothetical protein PKZ36_03290 [Candidatus Paceibacterota bacterium]|nr:hypothetical protein [Candidatus Paceibacterota bacterium]HPT18401.1 hypothetical protein [Candidatus Paceibacterota bacterium]
MSFKKIIVFLFLIFSLFPLQKVFAETENIGIIPANIWYSEDPFEEGQKVKIYTVVYNPSDKQLSGTVVFFDDDVFLGKKDFSVASKSIKDVSIDWTVTVGDHIIFAKIENAKFLISEGKYEEVYIAENKTEESKRTVSKKIDVKKSTSDTSDSSIVSTVKNTIEENTPAVVTETANNVIEKLEDTREKAATYSDEKKQEVKKEIEVLKEKEANSQNVSTDTKKDSEKVDSSNKLLKPLKYLELFFLNLFSLIFNTKILFYIVLIAVVFLILRFIWNLFF